MQYDYTKKGRVKSARNRRAFMKGLMNVDEAKVFGPYKMEICDLCLPRHRWDFEKKKFFFQVPQVHTLLVKLIIANMLVNYN